MPLQFTPSIGYQPDDTDGEIDVVITDYSPPLAALPNGPVLALRFDVVCEPDVADNSRISDITFSAFPPVSFGNPAGQGVPGTSSPGSVKISRGQTRQTPTPTPTAYAHAYPNRYHYGHADSNHHARRQRNRDPYPAHRNRHADSVPHA